MYRFKERHRPALQQRPSMNLADIERESWGNSRGIHSRLGAEGGLPLLLIAGVGGLILTFGLLGYQVVSAGNLNMELTESAEETREGRAEQDDWLEGKRLLESFMSSTSADEKLKLVRSREKVEPKLRRFYDVSDSIRLDSTGKAIELAGGVYAEVNLSDKSDVFWMHYRMSDKGWRTAVFEKAQAGLKLDWESLVAYEPVPWPEFIEDANGSAETFRLIVQEDDYFNFRYTDSVQFLCLKLQHMDRSETAWGYAEIGASVGRELQRLFDRAAASGKTSLNLTVSLQFVPHSDGLTHSQALLTEVVSDSWFTD
ncbi:MAG: hypothetical protein R3F19_06605 [Verrucomicrobiales bacterium]